ncbi:aldo/keto reductase [Alishewanella longhuensis]
MPDTLCLAIQLRSGKYLGGARPEGSRWRLVQRNGLFRDTPQSNAAIAAFVDLAAQLQLSPAQLALAWVNQVDGVTSTIIGATSTQQLRENLSAFAIALNAEVKAEVSAFLQQYPQPF